MIYWPWVNISGVQNTIWNRYTYRTGISELWSEWVYTLYIFTFSTSSRTIIQFLEIHGENDGFQTWLRYCLYIALLFINMIWICKGITMQTLADNINMDSTIAGSMNDNINMDSIIAGSMNDNINMDSRIAGSMNDSINMDMTQLFYCPCLCCHSLTLLFYCPCLCCHSLTLLFYCPCLCCHSLTLLFYCPCLC
jgi:hypothetical protein